MSFIESLLAQVAILTENWPSLVHFQSNLSLFEIGTGMDLILFIRWVGIMPL